MSESERASEGVLGVKGIPNEGRTSSRMLFRDRTVLEWTMANRNGIGNDCVHSI